MSEKYDIYPNEPLLFERTKASQVSVVIWNKNRMTLVEDINHLSQVSNDFHKCMYSLVFKRNDKDKMFTKSYSLR